MNRRRFAPPHLTPATFRPERLVVRLRHTAFPLTVFLLLALSAGAQQEAASSHLVSTEWQRIHEGLRKSRPAPEPQNALRLDTITRSGNLVQFDLNTLETNETAASTSFGALLSVNHLDGRAEVAPHSVDAHLGAPLQQQSPEGSGLAGAAKDFSQTAVIEPQPYLTPYAFPFSTQLRLLARFNVGGTEYYYSCSASQASGFHLLTAAHCIYNHDPTGDGSGAGAGFASEIWAWPAVTDVVDPIDPDNWPDFPFGVAKVAYQATYNAWILDGDLNWDVAFLTLDRRLGDHAGWMGREWDTAASSLNFDGYPSEAPIAAPNNPYQYPGYEAGNVRGYTCCRIEMNALTDGGYAGGGVWREDPADGSRYLEGVDSTSDHAGHTEATLLTAQIEADFESMVASDRALHAPADLPQLIEYVNDNDSKALVDTSVSSGGTFRLKLNAFNAGYASAGDATASVYLTKDPNNVAAGVFLEDLDLGDLDAYSYSVQTREVTVPATVAPGRYYVGYLLTAANPQYGADRNDVVIAKQMLAVDADENLKPIKIALTPSGGVIGPSLREATVTLNGLAPAEVIVTTSTSDDEIVAVTGKARIKKGEDSGLFVLAVKKVKTLTKATIYATYNKVTVHLDIEITPVGLGDLTIEKSELTGGKSTRGKVPLVDSDKSPTQAPAAGVEVKLQSTDPAAATVAPEELAIKAPKMDGFFVVTAKPVVKDTPVTITATYGGFVKTVMITVKAPALSGVSVDPAKIKAGAVKPVTVTVDLDGPAAAGSNIKVKLISSDATNFPVPATVTVKPGDTSATFNVTPKKTLKADVTITATYNKVSEDATLTVTK